MRVHVDDRVVTGRAVDLPNELPVDAVVAAVRDDHPRVTVECPDPGRVHRRLGVVDGRDVDVRRALATVARSRGEYVVEDRLRAARRRRIASMNLPDADVAAARRRVAEAAADEQRLRERVAELRGRRRERADGGGDVGPLADALADAVADLSEVETERIAAEEALAAATERARRARQVRERRFALEDEAANLARTARQRLAARVRPAVTDAVAAAPGTTATTLEDADPTTRRLALARVASLRAPVVLDCGRFPDAEAAAAWLDAPVLRV